jgi:hypothetical protein
MNNERLGPDRAGRLDEPNAEFPSTWPGELIRVDEVLSHLARLRGRGIGLKTVARISGVSTNVDEPRRV